MAAGDGIKYLLYVAATAPTDPYDSGATSYKAVGLLTDGPNIGRSRAEVDLTTKDDGINMQSVGGHVAVTVSGGGNFDHAVDEGQDLIQDRLEAADGDIWFLATTDVVGDEEYAAKASVLGFNANNPDGAPSAFDFSFKVTGALGRAAVS